MADKNVQPTHEGGDDDSHDTNRGARKRASIADIRTYHRGMTADENVQPTFGRENVDSHDKNRGVRNLPLRQIEPPAPYIPGEAEATRYLYGLVSLPKLVARTTFDRWDNPTQVTIRPKELFPLGPHYLDNVWESEVGPALHEYLVEEQIPYTILNPVRLGYKDSTSPSPVIMIGVSENAVSGEVGLRVAQECQLLLEDHDVKNVRVIIYECHYQPALGLYEPTVDPSFDPTARLREPFTTALGISICLAKAPHCIGTSGLFFIDTAKPGILYFLTARHVLFNTRTEENKHYRFREGSGSPKRKVMFMNQTLFTARCNNILSEIRQQDTFIEKMEAHVKFLNRPENKDRAATRLEPANLHITQARSKKEALQELHSTITKAWESSDNRILGHVTLSPPLTYNHFDGGYTEDWAVVEIDPQYISKLNFVGNVVALGSIERSAMNEMMYPRNENPEIFDYPLDCLHRVIGKVSDEEMYKPDPRTKDQNDDPVIMVLKNGHTTGLTVGRLNTIRAVARVRQIGKSEEHVMTREVTVLSQNRHTGPFSAQGDSGSAVIDGKGRVCGILTAGVGFSATSDVTFVTSINFLLRRLRVFGIKANILPTPADV